MSKQAAFFSMENEIIGGLKETELKGNAMLFFVLIKCGNNCYASSKSA